MPPNPSIERDQPVSRLIPSCQILDSSQNITRGHETCLNFAPIANAVIAISRRRRRRVDLHVRMHLLHRLRDDDLEGGMSKLRWRAGQAASALCRETRYIPCFDQTRFQASRLWESCLVPH